MPVLHLDGRSRALGSAARPPRSSPRSMWASMRQRRGAGGQRDVVLADRRRAPAASVRGPRRAEPRAISSARPLAPWMAGQQRRASLGAARPAVPRSRPAAVFEALREMVVKREVQREFVRGGSPAADRRLRGRRGGGHRLAPQHGLVRGRGHSWRRTRRAGGPAACSANRGELLGQRAPAAPGRCSSRSEGRARARGERSGVRWGGNSSPAEILEHVRGHRGRPAGDHEQQRPSQSVACARATGSVVASRDGAPVLLGGGEALRGHLPAGRARRGPGGGRRGAGGSARARRRYSTAVAAAPRASAPVARGAQDRGRARGRPPQGPRTGARRRARGAAPACGERRRRPLVERAALPGARSLFDCGADDRMHEAEALVGGRGRRRARARRRPRARPPRRGPRPRGGDRRARFRPRIPRRRAPAASPRAAEAGANAAGRSARPRVGPPPAPRTRRCAVGAKPGLVQRAQQLAQEQRVAAGWRARRPRRTRGGRFGAEAARARGSRTASWPSGRGRSVSAAGSAGRAGARARRAVAGSGAVAPSRTSSAGSSSIRRAR